MPEAKLPSDLGLDTKVTLDAVFRRNVLMRPGALALADPPDRAALIGSIPRRLNYAEADIAVTRIAGRLASLGLPEQSIVAIQLPNTVESVLSLLAVLRAGMVAIPLPLLWRRSDLIAALRDVGPSVIITMTRVGNERPAEIACEAAAELFTLGFPCAFGIDPPDGVIALDLQMPFSNNMPDLLPAPHVLSADSFAMATFDTARNGPFPVGRTHSQWLAAGLAVLLEAKIASGGGIISTLPPTSFAAIASAFVPWLLTGGTLQLAQGSSDQTSFNTGGAHLVAPATALNYLTSNVRDNFAAAIAIHRTPKSLSLDLSCANCEAIVDLQTFGEIGLSVLERIAKMMPSPIPIGKISAPAKIDGGPFVIETKRLDDGTLAVRGAMVPNKSFSNNGRSTPAQLEFEIDGFVRTNLKCHAIGSNGFVIDAPLEGVVQIGGLRYGVDDLTARIAHAMPNTHVSFTSDAVLGARLVIQTSNLPVATRVLDEAGLSRIIIEGLQERSAPQAAS